MNTLMRFIFLFFFRYPVIVKQFGINKGSGGDGCFKGGDGVIRELMFRKKQVLSILTERRTLQPYGLKGTNKKENAFYDKKPIYY